jgi:hypothetical protein
MSSHSPKRPSHETPTFYYILAYSYVLHVSSSSYCSVAYPQVAIVYVPLNYKFISPEPNDSFSVGSYCKHLLIDASHFVNMF